MIRRKEKIPTLPLSSSYKFKKQTEIKDFYQNLSKFRIQNSVEYSEKVGTNKKSWDITRQTMYWNMEERLHDQWKYTSESIEKVDEKNNSVKNTCRN